MAVDSHFIHRCDIQRGVEGEDDYNETTETFGDHLSDVRCRLVEKSEREGDSEFAANPLVTIYLLLLPAKTDVTEADRITNIRYEDGTTDARVFTVETLATRRARVARHLSLTLQRVR